MPVTITAFMVFTSLQPVGELVRPHRYSVWPTWPLALDCRPPELIEQISNLRLVLHDAEYLLKSQSEYFQSAIVTLPSVGFSTSLPASQLFPAFMGDW